ncbi:hypothetical protein I503_01108 [Candida albicans SC5314]|uniref:FHA domain-containing protein n=1 Tax=Candida albicans P78048 TaxID=1094989 RepID=A0AB34PYA0_CANAX|nr:hypothetical protein MG3_01150 [Candida albicans P78048]KGR22767.1 hypothetical protein MG9_01102 [Candida albicans P37037]KHC83877.1 hypothetical protein W5Q_01098 [Candida albicans SC5314]KHC89315.1 hypothetical protein I503_01108 [Candida albicans SC5314]
MSNMNYQFPPSSPLLEDYSYNSSKDPFTSVASAKSKVAEEAAEARVSRDNYPTPNPSSSLFRSSSPAREAYGDNDVFRPEPKQTANINKDFNVLNPDKSVMRIPLVNTHTHFSIGRSSRSCEFALTASDPRISRVHLKLSSSSQQIILTCLGSNGVGVIIPKPCFVYETNSPDNFIIMENTTGKPLDAHLHNYKLNKTIKLDGNHTEFFVRKGETITMPKFENILLQISKDIILLNPNDIDEDLTDEETPTLLIENDNTNTNNTTPMNKTVSLTLPKTPLKPKPKSIIKVAENNNEEPDETPSKEQRSVENRTFVLFEDKNIPSRSTSTSPKPPAVLADKTNIKRKATSEEPQIKKKKKQIKRQQTPELDNSVLALPNLAEIQNILINHLAFSRLSSTPASFLNTISVSTSKLSLAQIRAILHDLKCIGVIHRQGKDAAGQPLQEEYYYMPENDEDRERTTLVSNIKGHGGLRSCRKTHKQYYWKKPAPIKK